MEYPFIEKPRLVSEVENYRTICLEEAARYKRYEDICNEDGIVNKTHPLIQLFLFAREYPNLWNFQHKKNWEFVMATMGNQRMDLYWNGIWILPSPIQT